jgi:branched-chain amino acid transport system substrate-binding protein
MAAGSIISSIYLDLAGTASEGTIGIAIGLPQETMTGWKKFREKFVATYGNDLEYYAPFAYDAANVIIAAIRQSESLDPKRLGETLHKIKYRGLTGSISFDAQGNLNASTHTVFEVKQGKWVAMQSFGGK